MTEEKKAEVSRGTLAKGEAHPAVHIALEYLGTLSFDELCEWREAFASCAIESNRLGEVCVETLNRLLDKQPVSDRYLLGLAMAIARRQLIGEEKSDGSQKT